MSQPFSNTKHRVNWAVLLHWLHLMALSRKSSEIWDSEQLCLLMVTDQTCRYFHLKSPTLLSYCLLPQRFQLQLHLGYSLKGRVFSLTEILPILRNAGKFLMHSRTLIYTYSSLAVNINGREKQEMWFSLKKHITNKV